MENDWEYLHGRVNPGTDESLLLVETLDVKELEREDLQRRNDLLRSEEHTGPIDKPDLTSYRKSSPSGMLVYYYTPCYPTSGSLPPNQVPSNTHLVEGLSQLGTQCALKIQNKSV